MAVTQNLYTGNGSTTDFPFSFSYINPSYVKVSINGTLTTAFTFFTASILRFTTAPPDGAAIRIYRETTSNVLAADYTAGSALREQDLELTLQQVLDVTQETQTFAENQSTAGLQTQITAAGNSASTALTTANTAKATADGLAASIATANSNANSAVATANTASSNASTALSTANSISGAVTTAQTTADAAMPKTGGSFTGNITVPSINGGPLAGFRNLLINGNPIINQRGYVSGTATTGASQYALDRWQVVTSGQSISWTDSANVRTVTAPAGGVQQIIEGASILSGTYTLNWTGTATASISGAAVAKGANVTLIGGIDINVRFSGGTFALPQLEPGPVATPFERRPIGTELALCQRYFYKTDKGFSLQSYGSAAGSNTYAHLTHPVPMRATPTASATFVSGVNNQSQTITLSAQAFTIQLISNAIGEFAVVYSAGNTFSAEL